MRIYLTTRTAFVSYTFIMVFFIVLLWNGLPFYEDQPYITSTELVYEFQNGLWFDGTGFVKQTFYTQNGTLSSIRPTRVDSVIDLSGRWVVPPYGEAHNHNVEPSNRLPALINRYLEKGVYYVKNPNILPKAVKEVRGTVNKPNSIDVSFAFGGFTGLGGHPSGVVERNIRRGIWSESDGEGAFYYEIADEQELEKKWDGFLDYNPDFVKGYLLYSEEFDRRAKDDSYIGWRGLSPGLLQKLTHRAHKAGLRVSVHVETVQDFRNALDAGVDEINHLPGFRGNEENKFPNPKLFQLEESDAIRAAEADVVVVTTIGDFDSLGDEALSQLAKEVFRWNLEMLHKQKVRMAIGSDDYSSVGVEQAFQLLDLNIFTNLELLKMWVEETPRTIFPNRLIGTLTNGYEASFLVLDGNPLDDFKATQSIMLRVKQGVILNF